MAYSSGAIGARHRQRRRPGGNFLALPMLLLAAIVMLAACYVGFLLWPRWPGAEISPEAPSLPITVGGTAFNVPPAAIRVKVQRRPGTQERIDLVYLWPSLVPPSTAENAAAAPNDADRIFLTLAHAEGTLAPIERIRTIYPRYLEDSASAAPEGLASRAFRAGSPYQGEDLIYDPAAPDLFVVRCSRDVGPTRGTCLSDRRIGSTDITARFPRAWLAHWREVSGSIEQVIGGLRQRGG